ncbi:MAG: class I SAM-dependent methyltransferase [Actinomycetes bacterium]
MGFADHHLFGDTRAWVARQADGHTLEVGIGTGLNLPHYPTGVRLTGLDWSPGMLALAGRRAGRLGRRVTLVQGDARTLPYADAGFDTVVATFVLCGVPEEGAVLREMVRVLRPGGRLLLADHVASSFAPLLALQAAADLASVPLQGEHFRRRPVLRLPGLGLRIEEQQRFRLGLVERVVAVRPSEPREEGAQAVSLPLR